MNESRIAFFATLPMLIGAVLVLGLRKPPLTTVLDVHALPAANGAQLALPKPAQKPYPGVIVSGYTADVGAEIAGGVLEVMAKTGVHVSMGDALLRIDPKTAGEEVRVAEARLEQQRSSVERANAELNEAVDLVTRLRAVRDGVSERTLVAAETRVQQGKAAVAEATAGLGMHQAELGRMRTRSQKHVIRAPFDGVVVALYADPGDVVGPGQVVARVITEDYYVRFALPPDDGAARTPGRAVEVTLPSGELISAIVSDVQPEVDAAAQVVFARARLGRDAEVDGSGNKRVLTPGTQVEVRVAAVPAGASGGKEP
jgi:RND family efflux transporter MFP subunit